MDTLDTEAITKGDTNAGRRAALLSAIQLSAFAAPIFLGAVLVFGVQPIAARLLLPHFGGSPAVWNTTSLFFQVALLAGYAYSHLLTRWLAPRRQALMHLLVLVVPLLLLPLVIRVDDSGGGQTAPVIAVLIALAGGVGIPFAVAATTGPLLQRWFSYSGHPSAGDPYFLYAASNTGSLLVLLAYPLIFEPQLTLDEQRAMWSLGYVIFVVLATVAAGLVLRRAPALQARVAGRPDEALAHPLPWGTRLRWMTLAAVPAALSLGATQHLSTDVAAVPLLWVAPLAIYLASFIVAFSPRNPIGSRRAAVVLPVPAVAAAFTPFLQLPIVVVIGIHLSLLLLAALMCHGRLAEERPAPNQLTEFYLLLSLGGAIGGAFVSLAAPLVFDRIWEYPIAIVAALLLRPRIPGRPGRRFLAAAALLLLAALVGIIGGAWMPESVSLAGPVVVVAAGIVVVSRWRLAFAGVSAVVLAVPLVAGGTVIYTDRTFFGVYRVVDSGGRHELVHGNTVHGMQLPLGTTSRPPSYYHPSGPIGQVFRERGSRFGEIGVVGLGVGTLAAYGQEGQRLTFYEIDPGIVALAEDPSLFTYLADSKADLEVVVADGRLGLASESRRFDLLVIDAFSSDAIPVHLLTQEAVALYADRLTPGGLIAFHISNRYLELEPVLADIVESLELAALVRSDSTVTAQQAEEGKVGSEWLLIAGDEASLAPFDEDPTWTRPVGTETGRIWTDNYSDLIGALR